MNCKCIHCLFEADNGHSPTRTDVLRPKEIQTPESSPWYPGLLFAFNACAAPSCPLVNPNDAFNRLDAKWVANNLFAMPLDLSKEPYFTAGESVTQTLMKKSESPGWLYCQEFEERVSWSWLPNVSSKAPPIRSGQMQGERLNPKTACLLRRSGELFQRDGKGCLFLTLTYSSSLCQKDSKRHLDSFLKALARLAPGCDYFWVAELQKRGVIHYHVATNANFVPVEWLVTSWRRITNQPNLQPDVKRVSNPGHYMAKYMAKDGELLKPMPIVGKRAGFSRKLRKRMRPLNACRESMTWKEAESLLSTFPERHQIKYVTKHGLVCSQNTCE